jgi:DNA-3-methyladenine glycosylase II
LTEAEEFLTKDKYIAPLIQKWGSCDIEKQYKFKYFTNLVEAIVSQQLSGSAAETIFSRVKKLLIKITPENILSTNTEELRKCGLSYAKCSYVAGTP